MKITSTGDRLNLLITCDYSIHHDWMAFAAWYSTYKSLPDVDVTVLCARGMDAGRPAFNWPYRCDIRFFCHENIGKRTGDMTLNKLYATYVALKNEFVAQPLMVINCDTVALRTFSKSALRAMNLEEQMFGISGSAWYFKDQPIERFVTALNSVSNESEKSNAKQEQDSIKRLSAVMGTPIELPYVCCDCQSSELASFAEYASRCGRFVKDEWIKRRLVPPFNVAAEMLRKDGGNLNANEESVLETWNQMRQIYDVVR